MKILGAIIAGGRSTRFGSDKAYARYQGKRLIDLVGAALARQSTGLVICGREEDGFDCLADMPQAGLGPLGGLNSALHFAKANGFDAVLSAGCDIPNLPLDLIDRLAGDGPAIVDDQPIVGLWPTGLTADIKAFIRDDGRALYGFADSVNARRIVLEPPLMNVNRPEDLGS